MPFANQFRHQNYPTVPAVPPTLCRVSSAVGEAVRFEQLHTRFRVRDVLVVHGTFAGNDPFGIADTLRSIGRSLPAGAITLDRVADAVVQKTKPLADSITGDVGNYTADYVARFRELVQGDPSVELLQPPWTGQNHHCARADLAVRLFCRLLEFAPGPDERVLLWGHSHAGNAFAILSNLLANDRNSVATFFECHEERSEPHWMTAREELAQARGPHPLAWSLLIAAFGTPVRYGWDTSGFRHLTHFLHHRNYNEESPFLTKPLFPPQSLPDTVTAKYGDWVQAFGIVGTDVDTPVSAQVNRRLALLLESGLEEPVHGTDTRFLVPQRIRDACARWKTGTRCHADGRNLLLEYEPCGRRIAAGLAVEDSLLGHGVATTIDWLPAHLALLLSTLERDGVDQADRAEPRQPVCDDPPTTSR